MTNNTTPIVDESPEISTPNEPESVEVAEPTENPTLADLIAKSTDPDDPLTLDDLRTMLWALAPDHVEREQKLADLREKAESAKEAYNSALLQNQYAAARTAEKELEDLIADYAIGSRMLCFECCKHSENPMMAAVILHDYPVIGKKDEKDEDSTLHHRIIVEKVRNIDLLKLDSACDGIGADKHWMHICQKLNFLMTARVMTELKCNIADLNDSYAMTEIARQIDMGETPMSNTKLLKCLNMAVSAMLGSEYKAASHDVAYMKNVYAKKGKNALSVVCSNRRKFVAIMADVCMNILTKCGYKGEYVKKREK